MFREGVTQSNQSREGVTQSNHVWASTYLASSIRRDRLLCDRQALGLERRTRFCCLFELSPQLDLEAVDVLSDSAAAIQCKVDAGCVHPSPPSIT